MNEYDSGDELTLEERARFAALPRVAGGDPLAEDRTVLVLQARGLLRGARRRFRVELLVAAIAATLLVFVGGVEYGRRLAVSESERLPVELQVQRAGSAYVAALRRLSERASPDSIAAIADGLEAGSRALRAAAITAAQLAPDNAAVWRIRDGQELAASLPKASTQVWF